jgi:hypothetical protein
VAELALYSANHGSCIDARIVTSYRSYQYAATEDGDTVWLWGELNAHAYEWCVVSLELDAGIEEFYLVFSLTYLGKFLTPPSSSRPVVSIPDVIACRAEKGLSLSAISRERRLPAADACIGRVASASADFSSAAGLNEDRKRLGQRRQPLIRTWAWGTIRGQSRNSHA